MVSCGQRKTKFAQHRSYFKFSLNVVARVSIIKYLFGWHPFRILNYFWSHAGTYNLPNKGNSFTNNWFWLMNKWFTGNWKQWSLFFSRSPSFSLLEIRLSESLKNFKFFLVFLWNNETLYSKFWCISHLFSNKWNLSWKCCGFCFLFLFRRCVFWFVRELYSYFHLHFTLTMKRNQAKHHLIAFCLFSLIQFFNITRNKKKSSQVSC